MTTRRAFLAQTATLGAGFWIAGRQSGFGQESSPNAKLNLAFVGTGGQGGGNLKRLAATETVAALCDVDSKMLEAHAKAHPGAKTWTDYRKMLEEAKGIDGVVVSTPDHLHAVIAVAAMKQGKHVYCEKPLVHSVHEARVMAELAATSKVATQMGNGYGGDDLPGLLELAGPVREVHAWSNRPIWPQGLTRPEGTPAVPASLNWDLWIGPAPMRPYHPAYHPFKWRGWWDFGTGALGDMACHILDGSFRFLELGLPTAVEVEGPPPLPDSAPPWQIVTMEFPARGGRPPVKLKWRDGQKNGERNLPAAELAFGQKLGDGGAIYVGEKGTVVNGKLFPEDKFEGAKPKSLQPAYPGRHADWVAGCKTGSATGSAFKFAATMTEAILLGNVAYRVGRRIEWDAAAMKAKGCPEADALLKREYRAGWVL